LEPGETFIDGDRVLVGDFVATGFQLPTDAGADKVLTSDADGEGTWQTVVPGLSAPIVSSLPGTPVNGQECRYTPAGDVVWNLKFRTSTGKWHYIGGPPLVGRDDTDYLAPAGGTVTITGAKVTIPVAGIYIFEWGSSPYTSSGSFVSVLQLRNPANTIVDTMQNNQAGANQPVPISRTTLPISVTTGDTAILGVGQAASNNRYDDTWVKATPVRIG
jgi:hypothetical protein